MTWINEAKVRCFLRPRFLLSLTEALDVQAIYALDSGNVYDAYELYLKAGLYDAAHNIAVLELAPDTVIRQDLILLRELLEPFEGRPVSGWNERGKVGGFCTNRWGGRVMADICS